MCDSVCSVFSLRLSYWIYVEGTYSISIYYVIKCCPAYLFTRDILHFLDFEHKFVKPFSLSWSFHSVSESQPSWCCEDCVFIFGMECLLSQKTCFESYIRLSLTFIRLVLKFRFPIIGCWAPCILDFVHSYSRRVWGYGVSTYITYSCFCASLIHTGNPSHAARFTD